MPHFVRPSTAQEAILVELRRLIVARELLPGSKVLQDQIAKQMGVSRVPVREALKLLEGEGLVVSEPRRGMFVVELSPEELIQIIQLRRLLETDALAAALPVLGDDTLEAMEASMRDMDVAVAQRDMQMLSRANRTFHMAIVEPSGWDRYLRILNQLWDNSQPYWSYTSTDTTHHARRRAEHAAIFEAVRMRDVDLATQLLDAHRVRATEGTLRQVATQELSTPVGLEAIVLA